MTPSEINLPGIKNNRAAGLVFSHGAAGPWRDAMRGEVRETNEGNIIGGYRRKKAEREKRKKIDGHAGQRSGQAAATQGSTRGHVLLTDEVHWL